MPPLILTAKLDAESFGFFDLLRKKYFPKNRNFLAAHITLFHHLPDEERTRIEKNLAAVCAAYQPFAVRFPTLRFLGKGTAAEIESAELPRLRATLAGSWEDLLTAQDRQKFKAHITIQNKVAPVEAKKIFEFLQADWQPKTGEIVGLQLWYYLDGPWELVREFSFKDSED